MHTLPEKIDLVGGPDRTMVFAALQDQEAPTQMVKFTAADRRIFEFFLFYAGSTYATRKGFYSFVGGPAEPSIFGMPTPESRTFYIGKFNPTTNQGHLFEVPYDAQAGNPFLSAILYGGDGS